MSRPAGEPSQKYTYGTHGSPTTDALCEAINELEGAAGTVLVPSGLVAITLPLLAYLSAGDHALIVDSVYNPTRVFCDNILKKFGISVDYYDPEIGAGIAALIKPNTKLVHLEAPGSHTMEMQDVRAIADAAHQHGCVVMMDNTWATPVFFRPMDYGVDVVIHAATKYPSGHSDVLMGFVSANESTGRLCIRPTGSSACASPRMTPTRFCVVSAPWRCGSSGIRKRRSRSRNGWREGRCRRRAASRSAELPRTRHLEA